MHNEVSVKKNKGRHMRSTLLKFLIYLEKFVEYFSKVYLEFINACTKLDDIDIYTYIISHQIKRFVWV